MNAPNLEHRSLHTKANKSSRLGMKKKPSIILQIIFSSGVVKCTKPAQADQNQAIIDEGAARIVPRALTSDFKQTFFLKLG